MRKPLTLLLAAFFIVTVTVASACSSDSNGGSATATTSGMVTKSDVGAKTFSMKGKDGKDYEFKMVSGSKGDINEIKEHQDKKKEIEVKYRTGTRPYEVVFAD
jgi:hypothetical protein